MLSSSPHRRACPAPKHTDCQEQRDLLPGGLTGKGSGPWDTCPTEDVRRGLSANKSYLGGIRPLVQAPHILTGTGKATSPGRECRVPRGFQTGLLLAGAIITDTLIQLFQSTPHVLSVKANFKIVFNYSVLVMSCSLSS